MQIPIITPENIKDTELEALMRIGFCYSRITDKNLAEAIQECMHTADQFFKGSADQKAKWQLKEILDPNEPYQGYALRAQSKSVSEVEQLFFEPDSPFGPYQPHAEAIEIINDGYLHAICEPIMAAIFAKLNLSREDFIDATKDSYRSFVVQRYPTINAGKEAIRFNPHKDFGLITVLYYQEPGLEVHYQNQWHVIKPEPNCVVVNLGNAIELMTGKHAHSALHRVSNMSDNRISMVYFVNANHERPVRNYIDNSIVSPSGALFFKEQFTAYHDLDH